MGCFGGHSACIHIPQLFSIRTRACLRPDIDTVIPAFPLIDITVAAYLADDEFPPEVKFLFRRDITSFLSLEDTAALAGYVATRLMFIKHSLH